MDTEIEAPFPGLDRGNQVPGCWLGVKVKRGLAAARGGESSGLEGTAEGAAGWSLKPKAADGGL